MKLSGGTFMKMLSLAGDRYHLAAINQTFGVEVNMKDFYELTLEQLAFLRLQIDELVEIRQAQNMMNARRKIRSIAKEVCVSVESILYDEAMAEEPVPQRFQHPERPELRWEGRGRHPQWMKELLDAGKSIDELRVS
jgi:DNA-binding protein H-NS